ncbi:MAG: AAA family ATPase [Bacteroidetes Order II. Incertae sedis bacterium]|nr:AAA family ATPase [Bacteroidetes Order II. bacterium]
MDQHEQNVIKLTTCYEKLLSKNDASGWSLFQGVSVGLLTFDLVIINPKVGVQFMEVDDGLSEARSLTVHFESNSLEGVQSSSTRDQLELEGASGKFESSSRKHSRPKCDRPSFSKLRFAQHHIIGWYLPHIASRLQRSDFKALAPIKLAVWDPRITTEEFSAAYPEGCKYVYKFGSDAIKKPDLLNLLPGSGYQDSKYFSKSGAILLELLENSASQKKLKAGFALTPSQRRFVAFNSGKSTRVKGVAGSGKTVLCAEKAATIANGGRRVLLAHYNITLGSYLRHVLRFTHLPFRWGDIITIHFHGLCRLAFVDAGIDWPVDEKNETPPESILEVHEATEYWLSKYGAEYTDDARSRVSRHDLSAINSIKLDIVVPLLMQVVVLPRLSNPLAYQFDAIIIDEAQDMLPLWYGLFRSLLNDQGELFAVFDQFQDIYHRIPRGEGFKGRFASLKRSHRLPRQIQIEAKRFVEEFIPDYDTSELFEDDFKQLSMDYFNLVWRHISDDNELLKETVMGIYKWLLSEKRQKPKDIAILVPTHSIGAGLAHFFEHKGMNIDHVFGTWQNGRLQVHKYTFIASGNRSKISTYHSFKGWEAKNIILVIDESEHHSDEDLDILLFTSITRAKESLVVLNRLERYEEYGTGWPGGWHSH